MFGATAVWGIDLGESGIKAVKLTRPDKKRILIEDFVTITYAELQSDPPVERAELIRRGVTRISYRMASGDRVVAGMPSENILSRFIGLPPVEKRRIPEVVRYEARQQIPFDLSEVLWDYQRVRKEIIPGEEIEIGLFAVRREVVDHFLSLLEPLHPFLVGLQINPLAVYNFVRYDLQPEQPIIVIDLGAKSTDLIVIDGPKFWIRNLPIASNSFNQILQKKFNISFEEAESVKQKVEQSRYRNQIFEVLRPVIHDLIGEIQRSIGYYKTLSREAKFEEIVVLGQGYRLYGLNRVMNEELQYKIRLLDKPRLIEAPPGRDEELTQAMPGLGAALGSALYGLKLGDVTISLLPEEFAIGREIQRKRIPAIAAGVMLWAAMGLIYFGSSSSLRGLASLEGRGQRTISEFTNAESQYSSALQQGLRGDLEKFDNLLLWREYWYDVLHAFTDAVPHENPVIYISSVEKGTVTMTTAGEAGGPGGGASPRVGVGVGVGGGVGGGTGVGEGGGEGTGAPTTPPAFHFTARTDYRNGQEALIITLKKSLEDATIYPEKIKLFKTVQVDTQVTWKAGGDVGGAVPAGGGAPPMAGGGRGGVMDDGGAPAADTGRRSMSVLETVVNCTLYSPEEMRTMREEARKKTAESGGSAGDKAKGT